MCLKAHTSLDTLRAVHLRTMLGFVKESYSECDGNPSFFPHYDARRMDLVPYFLCIVFTKHHIIALLVALISLALRNQIPTSQLTQACWCGSRRSTKSYGQTVFALSLIAIPLEPKADHTAQESTISRYSSLKKDPHHAANATEKYHGVEM
ncbi:hypothetical protein FA15DRAFT_662160 [Coprinopsis marcescibilis]|uniref:Uncharacterized protein n=1 Tax=Coprinopsis marcescibilis TaxID=230819 RepID=A0A5C3K938_COPMA|nr:hypothetical protein FA15DRAFT_662160 [Coprinopsis marcescibilis]